MLCAHSEWRAVGREEVGARVILLRVGLATLRCILSTADEQQERVALLDRR